MIHGGYIYEQDIAMDFSVNLNPMPMPDPIRGAMEKSLSHVSHYPDPLQMQVRKTLSTLHGIAHDQVLGGNGASELIFGIVSMLRPKKALLLRPGFYGYEHALMAVDCKIEDLYLREEKNFVLGDEILLCLRDDLDLLILTNPNNPTGKLIDPELLKKILHQCYNRSICVLLDECFYEMSSSEENIAKRYQKLLFQYPNLYVIKAFTKLFQIPGIRAGYVLSQAKNLLCLRDYLPEWNMSVIAQETTVACATYLMQTDYLKLTRTLIREQRQFLQKGLGEMGIRVFDSDTSFLLVKSRRNLYRELLNHKILIRDCRNFKGLGEGYYRMAVKGKEENEQLLATLRSRGART